MRRSPRRLALQGRPLPLALLALLALPAAAEEKSLKPVVVTGTTIDDRFQDDAREPSSVVNLSGKQVEGQHADNLADILRAVPGVTLDTQGGDDLKIKFRGIENQRYMGEKPGVAIVIDGVPVFERTGKVNIDLDNIESIRVIKGGASYLFGEDALSGAVVITTKRGAGNKGLRVDYDAGSFDYVRKLARAGYAGEHLQGHLQVSERASDDFHFQSNYSVAALTGNLRWLIDERSDLTLGYEKADRFRDKHGTVTGVTQAAEDPQGTLGRDYARHFDVNLERANLTYANDLTPDTNLLALAYRYTDHTEFWSAPQRFSAAGTPVSESDAYTTANDYRQSQRGLKGELRTVLAGLGLMGGAELKRNDYENHTEAKMDYRSSPFSAVTTAGTVFSDDRTDEAGRAFYGEVKWSPVADWTFTGNARHDRITLDYHANPVAGNGFTTLDESKSFRADSWRVGAAWTATPATVLFGNVSTGFRIPTVDQLYRGSQSPSGSVANNPDLRPERAVNYELGLRSGFELAGRAVALEAALFQIDREDFILDTNGQYSSANADNIARYENIGGARSRGLELALHSAPADGWSWDLAYTWLDARFTRYERFLQSLGNPRGRLVGQPGCTGPVINWNNCYTLVAFDNTGNDVPRTSPHTVNLRASWFPLAGWKFGAEADYRSSAYADEINQEKWPGRTLLHLQVDYVTRPGWIGAFPGSRFAAFLRVENVFARDHYTIARGTNDSQSYASDFRYDGVYNAEDLSITVDPGRVWRAGVSFTF